MSQEQINIKTPEYVSLQFRLAGLGSRAAAMIMDQLLLGIVNAVLILLFIFVGKSSLLYSIGDPDLYAALILLLLFIIRWGYFFVGEYFFGGKTVGKKLIGIRVIQENGHRITFLSSLIRNLLRIVDSLPTGYFLGMMMVFLHSKHKRLGDLVAGTIVVHERGTKKKKNQIDETIKARGLTKESITVSDLTIQSLGKKEWKLLKTYNERFLQLPKAERPELTRKVARILLPKINVNENDKTHQELENTLLTLYLIVREEWEYEL